MRAEAARNNAEWCDLVSRAWASSNLEAAWAGAVRAFSTDFPGRPIVGYEQEADLPPALAAGFTTAGPLRIWVRE